MSFGEKSAPLSVLIYHVLSGSTCSLGDRGDEITLETLIAKHNNINPEKEYVVAGRLMTIVNNVVTAIKKRDFPTSDFGITILMLHYAIFHGRSQLALFTYEFGSVAEIKLVYDYLSTYRELSIYLPTDLATDAKYGLKKIGSKFNGKNCLTVELFGSISRSMKSPKITPEAFIESLCHLNVHIVQSFYMFTSIKRDLKEIAECNDYGNNTLDYKFEPFRKSSELYGDFWFVMPANAVRFAYLRGNTAFSTYTGRDVNVLMQQLSELDCFVVGFISNNQIYPLAFHNERTMEMGIDGQWLLTIKKIKELKLNCVYKEPPIPENMPKVHFVKLYDSFIYKYAPIKPAPQASASA